jgi:hypothetical protein
MLDRLGGLKVKVLKESRNKQKRKSRRMPPQVDGGPEIFSK